MAAQDVPLSPTSSGFTLRWSWIFLVFTATLSSTIVLKIGQLQYLEILSAFQIALLLVLFLWQHLRAPVVRVGIWMLSLYTVFAALAFALALYALRNPFFPQPDINFLTGPVWITVSRIAELAIDVGLMVYLTQVFTLDRARLLFTMKLYFWTGVASGVFSIISYPLSVLKIGDFGVYSVEHRMRGFYNEGGPYGTYLLSVFVVAAALWQMRAVRQRHLVYGLAPLFIAVLGARSKAVVVAIGCILVVDALLAKGIGKRAVMIGALLVAVTVFSFTFDFKRQLSTVSRAGRAYEYLSHFHHRDPNFVAGRVAGGFLVPRMIRAHPWAGIGWGNYGLVRNDVTYRGASAWIRFSDDPGLGFFGRIADFGIPLSLFLLVCQFFPFVYLRRRGAPLYIQNLALVQPVCHIFGAQLNTTFPWVVTAFALGVGYFYAGIGAEPAAPSSLLSQPGPAPSGLLA